MAYATGPVSDVTRVVRGPSHGRFVPVSAAKAPLKPTATMNASIRATRRVPGRFAMNICTRFISFPPVPFGTSLCEMTFVLRAPDKLCLNSLGVKALILASEDSDHPGIQ